MEPTKNFVPLPRRAISDVLKGKMTGAEYFVYAWIRGKGNPRGVAQVSIPEIVAVYPHRVSENHIYKLIRSLRTKKYLYYPSRPGRRGSFEVEMGEWTMPDSSFKTLERFFEREPLRAPQVKSAEPKPEVNGESQSSSQGFEMMKKYMATDFNRPKPKQ
jgi:hypothetical protein